MSEAKKKKRKEVSPFDVLTYFFAGFAFLCVLGLMWLNWTYGNPFIAMTLGLFFGAVFAIICFHLANEAAVERRNQAQGTAPAAPSGGGLVVRSRSREGVSTGPEETE